jgi:hypothetical protein
MKKLFIPFLLLLILPATFSCSGPGKLGRYILNENDAQAAIRQLLQIGTRDGVLKSGAFSKENMLAAILPEGMRKVLNTVQTLGLSSEVDRFTNTLSTAAEQTALKSTPVFLGAIDNLKFTDAMRLIKNGGTSATDYLRSSAGNNLRQAIKPIMQSALDEYKLNDQWNAIFKSANILGGKVNLDLSNLMAGLVAEAMFQKIEEKEREIRTQASARSTNLLQKVFSRDWN